MNNVEKRALICRDKFKASTKKENEIKTFQSQNYSYKYNI